MTTEQGRLELERRRVDAVTAQHEPLPGNARGATPDPRRMLAWVGQARDKLAGRRRTGIASAAVGARPRRAWADQVRHESPRAGTLLDQLAQTFEADRHRQDASAERQLHR